MNRFRIRQVIGVVVALVVAVAVAWAAGYFDVPTPSDATPPNHAHDSTHLTGPTPQTLNSAVDDSRVNDPATVQARATDESERPDRTPSVLDHRVRCFFERSDGTEVLVDSTAAESVAASGRSGVMIVSSEWVSEITGLAAAHRSGVAVSSQVASATLFLVAHVPGYAAAVHRFTLDSGSGETLVRVKLRREVMVSISGVREARFEGDRDFEWRVAREDDEAASDLRQPLDAAFFRLADADGSLSRRRESQTSFLMRALWGGGESSESPIEDSAATESAKASVGEATSVIWRETHDRYDLKPIRVAEGTTLRISGSGDGLEAEPTSVTVADRNLGVFVPVRLRPTLRVRITRNGEAVPSATVEVSRVDAESSATANHQPPPRRPVVTTKHADRRGGAWFPVESDTLYRVSARTDSERAATEFLTDSAGGTVTLELDGAPTVSGVLTGADGIGIPGVEMVAKDRPGGGGVSLVTLITGPDGRFSVTIADDVPAIYLSMRGYANKDRALSWDYKLSDAEGVAEKRIPVPSSDVRIVLAAADKDVGPGTVRFQIRCQYDVIEGYAFAMRRLTDDRPAEADAGLRNAATQWETTDVTSVRLLSAGTYSGRVTARVSYGGTIVTAIAYISLSVVGNGVTQSVTLDLLLSVPFVLALRQENGRSCGKLNVKVGDDSPFHRTLGEDSTLDAYAPEGRHRINLLSGEFYFADEAQAWIDPAVGSKRTFIKTVQRLPMQVTVLDQRPDRPAEPTSFSIHGQGGVGLGPIEFTVDTETRALDSHIYKGRGLHPGRWLMQYRDPATFMYQSVAFEVKSYADRFTFQLDADGKLSQVGG